MSSISELVAQLGSDDQTKAYQARKGLIEAVSRAAKPADQKPVAAELASALTATTKTKGQGGKEEEQPKFSPAVRNQVSQYLAQVADDEQVPALAAALGNLETREMARWALDRIPTEAATKALVAALEQVGPEFRVGVINALGKRKGTDVQAALLRAAGDDDMQVRFAAVEALANLPEPSNDEPIAAATKVGPPRARNRAQKARVRFAETLRLAGKKDAAIAVYKSIIANDADEPQKKAAKMALEQLT